MYGFFMKKTIVINIIIKKIIEKPHKTSTAYRFINNVRPRKLDYKIIKKTNLGLKLPFFGTP